MDTKPINSLCDFSVFKLQTDAALISFLNAKKSLNLKKGGVLINENEAFKGVYFIRSGLLKIYRTKSNQQEFIIGLGKKGGVVGIDSVISNSPYPHSIKALNDIEVYHLNVKEISYLFETYKPLRNEFIKELCADIDKLENRITSILNKKIKSQLAEILLAFSDFENNNNAVVKLSTLDISKLIGTTQNYICKIINNFIKSKLVEVEGKKIKIINCNELSVIASEIY